MTRARAELAMRVLEVSFAVVVVGSILAVASVHPGVLAVVGIGTAVMCTALGVSLTHHPLRIPAPVYVLLGLAAFSLLQTIPVPIGVLSSLSPVAADVWARCLAPFGGGLERATLSLDPYATTIEASKLTIYAAVFWAGTFLAGKRGFSRIAIMILATAVAVALITLAHELIGLERVYGIYEPRNSFDARRIGPLLNENNLGGFLNLGMFVGLGLLLQRKRSAQWLIGAAVVVLMATAIRTGSRGAVLSLAIGLPLVLFLRLRRSQTPVTVVKWAIPALTAVLAAAALFVVVGGTEELGRELTNRNAWKLRLPTWTYPMFRDHWAFGIGRGAFESVFPAYRPPIETNLVFTHPENIVAQWGCEWGVVGLVALIVLGFMLRPTRLGAHRSILSGAAYVGAAMLLLQNVADLSLELPGVAISFFAVLGGLWGRRNTKVVAPRPHLVGTAAATAVVSLALGGLILSVPKHLVAQDRDRLFALLHDSAAFPNAVRSAMLAHPAEPYFPLLGATVAVERKENAMPWLQRALERGPYFGRTHLVLAAFLVQRGARNQGLFELKLAATYENALTEEVAKRAVQITTRIEDLERAIPEGPKGVAVMNTMAALLASRGLDEARHTLDAKLLARDPLHHDAHARSASALFSKLERDTAPCDRGGPSREQCEQEIRRHAEALTKHDPESPEGATIEARLLLMRGDPKDARLKLSAACELRKANFECYQLLLPLVEDATERTKLSDRISSLACQKPDTCANANDWLGGFHAARASWGQAFTARARAAKAIPTAERWLVAAETADQAGLTSDMSRALESLERMKPPSEYAARIAALRAKSGR